MTRAGEAGAELGAEFDNGAAGTGFVTSGTGIDVALAVAPTELTEGAGIASAGGGVAMIVAFALSIDRVTLEPSVPGIANLGTQRCGKRGSARGSRNIADTVFTRRT